VDKRLSDVPNAPLNGLKFPPKAAFLPHLTHVLRILYGKIHYEAISLLTLEGQESNFTPTRHPKDKMLIADPDFRQDD